MFGDKLRDVRVMRNMEQQEVAALCGVTDGTVSNWELGKNFPTIKNAIAISSVFPEIKDDIIMLVENSELAALRQELEEVKAERDVWKQTTFDLLKEKQQWQQSSGV